MSAADSIGAMRFALLLSILTSLVGAPVQADDASLIELLRQKNVLSAQEYERVKGSHLAPAEKQELIQILREKGVLSEAESLRVQQAATPPEKTTPPPEKGTTPATDKDGPPRGFGGYDDGFFLSSGDGNLRLRLNGRAAANVLFEEPDTSLTDTIVIDRARLSADATFYKYFRARVEGEFTANPVLRDAFLALQPMPELNVQIGQFTVPFSYELLLSKLRTDFVERSAVVNQTVNPRRDIGLMVHGQLIDKRLQYQLAVMNGAGQNRSDNNSDKDLVARFAVAPFRLGEWPHLKGLDLGGAVTYGHQPRETTKNSAGITTYVSNSISGSTEAGFGFYPAIARHGARVRTDVHAVWFDGPFSVTSEYMTTSEERNGLGTNGVDLPDFDTDGAYVGGTWLLTGETKASNARVRPLHPLWSGEEPGSGAWEAALRYEYFKLRHGGDSASMSKVENRYDAILAGLNWFPNEFLRFSLNYIYSTYDGQGIHLAPNLKKRSNNAVLGRAQVDF